MTAQLLEYTSESDVIVRRVQAARSASTATAAPHRPAAVRAETRWGSAQARACEVSRPARTPQRAQAPAATRLEWTPRGIAVLVLMVALLAGVMLATLVGAFLSVSNEPAGSAPAVVVAMAALQPGR